MRFNDNMPAPTAQKITGVLDVVIVCSLRGVELGGDLDAVAAGFVGWLEERTQDSYSGTDVEVTSVRWRRDVDS